MTGREVPGLFNVTNNITGSAPDGVQDPL